MRSADVFAIQSEIAKAIADQIAGQAFCLTRKKPSSGAHD